MIQYRALVLPLFTARVFEKCGSDWLFYGRNPTTTSLSNELLEAWEDGRRKTLA